MVLPSPSRLAIAGLIRIYLVPRPPDDPESVAALQGGPVVQALACSAALGGTSLTAEQVGAPVHGIIGGLCNGSI